MAAGFRPNLSTPAARRNVLAFAVASCFASHVFVAHANPTGAQVVNGSAAFNQVGKTLNITNSPGAIINWQGFSIGADEVTRFIQSGANSAVLNRVIGGGASNILGQLLSNGRVFLINPNGVFIGGGAVIDVAGLTVSTLGLTDADFLAGRFKFTDQIGAAKLVNQGTIKTPQGGVVYLIAPNVENHGVITSPNGEVILAAGKSVEIVNPASPNVRVEVTASQGEAVNVSKIIAEGGRIGLFGTIVRQKGLVSANTASVNAQGRVVLHAKKDVVLEAGSRTEASGPAGGTVTVKAETGTATIAGTVEARAVSTPTIYQLRDPVPTGHPASDVQSIQPQAVPVTVTVNLAPPAESDVALVRPMGQSPVAGPGIGGTVQVLGDKVALVSNAVLDVSGDFGGGTVLVGGDYQGLNPDVMNAQTTFVGPGVKIIADAIARGDGGKAIVWADKATHFVGSLSARGGNDGGNGGFAEISGKHALYARGRLSLGAPSGRPGTVLFDPDYIEIVGGAATDGDDALTSDTTLDASGTGAVTGEVRYDATPVGTSGTPFRIYESEIEGTDANIVLQAGISITTTASGTFTNTGNTGDLSGSGVLALKTNRSLTLETKNDVTSGSINVSAVHIKTDAGSITINAGTGVNGGSKGDVVVGALTTQNSGNVNLSAAGTGATIALNGNITTASGTVQLTGSTVLGASVAIGSTGSGAGNNITFSSFLNGTADHAQNLSLTAGTGDVTFSQAVGTTVLGDVTISTANNVLASSTFAAKSLTQTAGTGSTTFNGITTTGAADTAGGAVSITTSGTLNSGAITAKGGAAGTGNPGQAGGTVALSTTGAGSMLTTGAIDTSGSDALTGAGGAGGAVSLTTTDGAISAGALTTNGGSGVGAVGGAAGNIDLATSGTTRDVTLNGALTALGGSGTTSGASGTVTLTATGAVGDNSAAGSVLADKLRVSAANSSSLTKATNDVVTLAVNITGAGQSFTYTDATGVAIGTVGATSGITTNGGAVVLKSGGALTVSQAIVTTPTTADTAGGTVVLEAVGGITTQTSGTITTDGAGNAAGGEVLLVNATSGAITMGQAISAQGGSSGTPGTGSDGGVVTLINMGGGIVLNESLTVSKNAAGTNDGTIQLKASGDITDGANGNLVGNTTGLVNAVSTGGKIMLDRNDAIATDGHSVAKVSLETTDDTAADRSIVFHEASALEVVTATATGALSTPGSVVATSVGSRSQGVKTVAGTSNGAVVVKSDGALTVNEAINTSAGTVATAGGAVVLEAGGAITLQSNGTVTTTGTTSGAGGEVFIHASTGDITLDKAVTAQGAGAGNGGVVTVLADSGKVMVNAGVDVSKGSSGADGTIQLKASGDITDGANGHLVGNTNGLVNAVSTGGKIVLDRNDAITTDGHSVAKVSLETSGTGGDRSIVFHEASALEVVTATASGALSTPGSVAATSVGNRAQGVKTVAGTSNGAVVLKSGGALTVSQAMVTTASGGGAVGGAVTLTSTGSTVSVGTVTTFGGAVTVSSSGNTILTGATIDTSGSAAGGNVTFNNNVVLSGAETITTGGTGSGNITFSGTLDGTTGGTDTLALTAGTGNVVFTGAVGSGTRVGAITINSATDVTAAALKASSLVQSAGSGTTTLNGAVEADALAGVNLTAATIVVNNTITTANSGVVTLNAGTGGLTIAAAGDINADGAVSLTGGGTVKINTAGDVTTTNDNVIYNSDTTLAGAVAIGTGTGAGNITFSGKLDDTGAGAETLGLTAGTGNVVFAGAVGSGTRVGAITINSATDVTAAALKASSLVQSAGSGTTTLQGAVDTDTATGLQITTSNINVAGGVTTIPGSVGVVTFSNSGTLSVSSSINADGDVTVNGSGTTLLNGDIVTTTDLVQFQQPVLITGNRSIDTTAASTLGNGGAIQFLSSVNGGGNALSLAAPSASGNILFNGAVSNLVGLTVSSARNFTLSASGSMNFGTGGIGVTAAGATSLSGSIATSNGGTVTLTNAGALSINADINSDGAITQNGAGAVSVGGAGTRSITTTADNVNILRGVTLGVPLSISTVGTGAGAGDVTFQSTLDGGQNLTVSAGSSNVFFSGAVGGTTRLGAIQITNANDVTESSGVKAASLVQLAGTGTMLLTGAVDTDVLTGVNLTGNAITVNGTVTTGNGGTVTLTNAGALSINADISSDGAITQNGAGAVSVGGAGTRSITTSADNVNFLRGVTLGVPLLINTAGVGAGSGDVTFQSTLDGGQNLTVNAVSSNVLFSGAVGGSTRLGAIQIANANNVTESSGVRAASLVQLAGTGTTLLTGAVDTDVLTGVNLTGNVITVNGTVTTSNGGTVTLTNAGALSINADISSDGAITQNGAGALQITGGRNLVTTGDAIGFSRAVTVAGGSLNIDATGSGTQVLGAPITFGSSITGGGNHITMNSGSAGDLTLVGVVSGVGNFTVNNAGNVNVSAISASGLLSITGQGNATLAGAVSANGPVTLAVNDLDLQAVVDASANTVQIRPALATRSITVGSAGVGTLQLTSAELGRIITSRQLTVGGVNQSGPIAINGPVASPGNATGGLAFVNHTGGIAVNAPITYLSGAGNLTLTANGDGTHAGAITGNGSDLLTASNLFLNAGSGIGTLTNPLHVQNASGTNVAAVNLRSAPGVTAGDISLLYSGAGDFRLLGFNNATEGGAIRVEVPNGSIDTGAAQVSSQGSVNLLANAVGAPAGNTATVTVGTGGISAKGKILLRAADDLTVNGAVSSAGGDVLLIAGNSSGMNPAANTGLQKVTGPASLPDGNCATNALAGCVYAATESASDTFGSVTINAQVQAGTGDIVIAATNKVSQPSTGSNGLINSGGGSLVVRTFNDVSGGASIALGNGTTGGNQNGSGGVTLETRMSGDADYSAAHPADFAASDIDYKSLGGLVIKGVGTAANYVGIASSQNIDLNALGIQAKNLTLIATNGDVVVNTQIKNSSINNGKDGGSMTLLAKNDIKVNWVPGTNDVTIGEAEPIELDGTRKTTTFNHALNLVSSGNIEFRGAAYVEGDLTLRAGASLAEATALGAPMALGSGAGGVVLSYDPNASQPLEVKATNILIGGKSGTIEFPVSFVRLDASTGTVATAVGKETVRKDVQLIARDKIEILLGGTGGPGASELRLTGGQASGKSGAGQVAKVSAVAAIESQNMVIKGSDAYGKNDSSIVLQGGKATGDNRLGGGVVAFADSLLLAKTTKEANVGGGVTLSGGETTKFGSAVVSAGVGIDPAVLNLVIGGNLVLQGGIGQNAAASIVNEGDITIRIGGKAPHTYTSTTLGAQTTANGGLILIGNGLSSGIFNGQNFELDGNDLPVRVTFTDGGTINKIADSGRGSAYIQTGVKLFDTSLLNYLIFAANEETRTSRLRAGLTGGDDSNLPACN